MVVLFSFCGLPRFDHDFWALALFLLNGKILIRYFVTLDPTVILSRSTKKSLHARMIEQGINLGVCSKGAENICVLPFYLKCCSIVKLKQLASIIKWSDYISWLNISTKLVKSVRHVSLLFLLILIFYNTISIHKKRLPYIL